MLKIYYLSVRTLTPYNQRLAWMCRELKRAKKIYYCWISKGIIKFKWTVNEQPVSVNHKSEIKCLYPDFIFKERQNIMRRYCMFLALESWVCIHKDIFACQFSIHSTISLSCHEQVCLSGLRYERYFSHHRACIVT